MRFEQYKDLTDINDSMELDSGTEICYMCKDGREAYIKVQGYVNVEYQGERYRHASDMPKELLEMFHNGSAYSNDEVNIFENNWFELFYGETDSVLPSSDVVDVENNSKEELLALCEEVIEWVKEEEKQ